MTRISLLLLLLGALCSLTAAASAPLFCKCTCFKSSEIIPLTPGYKAPDPKPDDPFKSAAEPSSTTSDIAPTSTAEQRSSGGLSQRASSPTCSQCNKAFCLKYNLPICKGAEEKDVVTMCFQRDSRKDQIIVWAFILGTVGLLGWAGLQRIREMRERKSAGIGAGGGLGMGAGGPRRDGPGSSENRGPYRAVGEDDSPAG